MREPVFGTPGVAVAALAVLAAGWLLPGSAPAQTSPPKPNLVLVLTDDQSLGSLDQMRYVNSRTDWFRFNRAFLNNPLCCPSRATLLTGRYSHHTGIEANDNGSAFDDSFTLATRLRDAGYQTGLVGKYLNEYPWGRGNYVPPGWTYWAAFKKTGYYDYNLNLNGVTEPHAAQPADYSTDVLGTKAEGFVSSATEPFFLWFAPNAPHAPATPAPRHVGTYSGFPIERAPNFNEQDVSDKPTWFRALPLLGNGFGQDSNRRKELESLQAVDESVGRLFDALAARGALDRTTVVFMSDNGFSFGAHRWVGKRCAYEDCVRTPLLVRYPPNPPKTFPAALVSNVDIAPTFADIAGISSPASVDGYSLLPLLNRTTSAVRTEVLLRGKRDSGGGANQPPSFWGVRNSRYKYVRTEETGEEELYDLTADPFELNNVHGQASLASVEASLKKKLVTLRGF
jgi:arylsulfatase A-like enzyme